ncbi:MAG TPA: hypothetical protein VFQ71_11280 [Gaiellales bacterium]|nr:hypothetical protein [Gaiellales bacterium]
MSSTDAWHWALAVFLILTAISLTYVLIRMGGTLGRVDTMLDGVSEELVPMLGKVSTSLDHVNSELDKVGQITDSAVDATAKVDHTVRTVSDLMAKPVKAANGMSAGVKHGFESFKARRDHRGGVV